MYFGESAIYGTSVKSLSRLTESDFDKFTNSLIIETTMAVYNDNVFISLFEAGDEDKKDEDKTKESKSKDSKKPNIFKRIWQWIKDRLSGLLGLIKKAWNWIKEKVTGKKSDSKEKNKKAKVVGTAKTQEEAEAKAGKGEKSDNNTSVSNTSSNNTPKPGADVESIPSDNGSAVQRVIMVVDEKMKIVAYSTIVEDMLPMYDAIDIRFNSLSDSLSMFDDHDVNSTYRECKKIVENPMFDPNKLYTNVSFKGVSFKSYNEFSDYFGDAVKGNNSKYVYNLDANEIHDAFIKNNYLPGNKDVNTSVDLIKDMDNCVSDNVKTITRVKLDDFNFEEFNEKIEEFNEKNTDDFKSTVQNALSTIQKAFAETLKVSSYVLRTATTCAGLIITQEQKAAAWSNSKMVKAA